jgi:hypothetical protein
MLRLKLAHPVLDFVADRVADRVANMTFLNAHHVKKIQPVHKPIPYPRIDYGHKAKSSKFKLD